MLVLKRELEGGEFLGLGTPNLNTGLEDDFGVEG